MYDVAYEGNLKWVTYKQTSKKVSSKKAIYSKTPSENEFLQHIDEKQLEISIKPKIEFLLLTHDGKTIQPENYRFENIEENLRMLVEKEVFKKQASGGKPRVIEALEKFGFEWEPASDSGHMRYGPKAALMVDLVGDYAWQSGNELNIPSFSIKGTNMFNINTPAIQEHANLFGERLYTIHTDDKDFILRYAACFQQFSMLKDWTISYRHIPFGMFEIADSYRLEQSGECLLGFRLRRFYLPDYHILCRDLEHAKELTLKVHEKIHEKMRELGNEYVSLYNLTESFFEENRDFIERMVKSEKYSVLLHFAPEKRYYWVINVEYHLTDELKRSREIATIQIDIGNARRFGVKYTTETGNEAYPPILHIAVLGGIERYLYAVFDTALRLDLPRLPLWLSPIQVRVIPVSERFLSEADKIADEIERSSLRVDVDDRALTLSKKVRNAEAEWINYVVVVGKKEIESGTLSIRDREAKGFRKMSSQQLVDMAKSKIGDKPFRRLNLPRHLSRRPLISSH